MPLLVPTPAVRVIRSDSASLAVNTAFNDLIRLLPARAPVSPTCSTHYGRVQAADSEQVTDPSDANECYNAAVRDNRSASVVRSETSSPRSFFVRRAVSNMAPTAVGGSVHPGRVTLTQVTPSMFCSSSKA